MNRIVRIFCTVMVAVMLLTVLGCTQPQGSSSATTTAPTAPAKLEVNMSLTGVWVTADGQVQSHLERVLFTVSGSLPAEFEPYSNVEMELDFLWPESFGYQNAGKQTYVGGASMTDRHENQQPIYHGIGWFTDDSDQQFSLSFTICPDAGFVVIHADDRYLVASTDDNVDPAEIFAFYKTYVSV